MEKENENFRGNCSIPLHYDLCARINYTTRANTFQYPNTSVFEKYFDSGKFTFFNTDSTFKFSSDSVFNLKLPQGVQREVATTTNTSLVYSNFLRKGHKNQFHFEISTLVICHTALLILSQVKIGYCH